MVCRYFSQSMGCASQFFCSCLKVFATGSVDWMGLSPSIRSTEIADQQQSISDPAQLAFFRNWLPASYHHAERDYQPIGRRFFGHPVVLLEIFVDPQRFRGTIYKADNWIYAGKTKGFHRTRRGYSTTADSPKMVFVKPLISNAQALFIPDLFSNPITVQEVQELCSVLNT